MSSNPSDGDFFEGLNDDANSFSKRSSMEEFGDNLEQDNHFVQEDIKVQNEVNRQRKGMHETLGNDIDKKVVPEGIEDIENENIEIDDQSVHSIVLSTNNYESNDLSIEIIKQSPEKDVHQSKQNSRSTRVLKSHEFNSSKSNNIAEVKRSKNLLNRASNVSPKKRRRPTSITVPKKPIVKVLKSRPAKKKQKSEESKAEPYYLHRKKAYNENEIKHFIEKKRNQKYKEMRNIKVVNSQERVKKKYLLEDLDKRIKRLQQLESKTKKIYKPTPKEEKKVAKQPKPDSEKQKTSKKKIKSKKKKSASEDQISKIEKLEKEAEELQKRIEKISSNTEDHDSEEPVLEKPKVIQNAWGSIENEIKVYRDQYIKIKDSLSRTKERVSEQKQSLDNKSKEPEQQRIANTKETHTNKKEYIFKKIFDPSTVERRIKEQLKKLNQKEKLSLIDTEEDSGSESEFISPIENEKRSQLIEYEIYNYREKHSNDSINEKIAPILKHNFKDINYSNQEKPILIKPEQNGNNAAKNLRATNSLGLDSSEDDESEVQIQKPTNDIENQTESRKLKEEHTKKQEQNKNIKESLSKDHFSREIEKKGIDLTEDNQSANKRSGVSKEQTKEVSEERSDEINTVNVLAKNLKLKKDSKKVQDESVNLSKSHEIPKSKEEVVVSESEENFVKKLHEEIKNNTPQNISISQNLDSPSQPKEEVLLQKNLVDQSVQCNFEEKKKEVRQQEKHLHHEITNKPESSKFVLPSNYDTKHNTKDPEDNKKQKNNDETYPAILESSSEETLKKLHQEPKGQLKDIRKDMNIPISQQETLMLVQILEALQNSNKYQYKNVRTEDVALSPISTPREKSHSNSPMKENQKEEGTDMISTKNQKVKKEENDTENEINDTYSISDVSNDSMSSSSSTLEDRQKGVEKLKEELKKLVAKKKREEKKLKKKLEEIKLKKEIESVRKNIDVLVQKADSLEQEKPGTPLFDSTYPSPLSNNLHIESQKKYDTDSLIQEKIENAVKNALEKQAKMFEDIKNELLLNFQKQYLDFIEKQSKKHETNENKVITESKTKNPNQFISSENMNNFTDFHTEQIAHSPKNHIHNDTNNDTENYIHNDIKNGTNDDTNNDTSDTDTNNEINDTDANDTVSLSEWREQVLPSKIIEDSKNDFTVEEEIPDQCTPTDVQEEEQKQVDRYKEPINPDYSNISDQEEPQNKPYTLEPKSSTTIAENEYDFTNERGLGIREDSNNSIEELIEETNQLNETTNSLLSDAKVESTINEDQELKSDIDSLTEDILGEEDEVELKSSINDDVSTTEETMHTGEINIEDSFSEQHPNTDKKEEEDKIHTLREEYIQEEKEKVLDNFINEIKEDTINILTSIMKEKVYKFPLDNRVVLKDFDEEIDPFEDRYDAFEEFSEDETEISTYNDIDQSVEESFENTFRESDMERVNIAKGEAKKKIENERVFDAIDKVLLNMKNTTIEEMSAVISNQKQKNKQLIQKEEQNSKGEEEEEVDIYNFEEPIQESTDFSLVRTSFDDFKGKNLNKIEIEEPEDQVNNNEDSILKYCEMLISQNKLNDKNLFSSNIEPIDDRNFIVLEQSINSSNERMQIFHKLLFDCVNQYIMEYKTMCEQFERITKTRGYIFGRDVKEKEINIRNIPKGMLQVFGIPGLYEENETLETMKAIEQKFTLYEFIKRKISNSFHFSQSNKFHDLALMELLHIDHAVPKKLKNKLENKEWNKYEIKEKYAFEIADNIFQGILKEAF